MKNNDNGQVIAKPLGTRAARPQILEKCGQYARVPGPPAGRAGKVGGFAITSGMGRRIFLKTAMASTVLAALGCGGRGSGGAGSEADADGVMTMTTSDNYVSFTLKGSGTASIDWDDGSEIETVYIVDDALLRLSREFSNTNTRTIAIFGMEITDFRYGGNKLTALDVSRNTALKYLSCGENQLTELDVSQNTALEYLMCYDNQLTALDVSRNTALKYLACWKNQLTTLDVSRNTALTNLDCWNNQLTTLDVSRNTELTRLSVENNQFTAASLNALFGSLQQGNSGEIIIAYNPGSADCDPSIAEAKGWTVEGFTGGAVGLEEQLLENVFFVTEDDWEGVKCEIIIQMDGGRQRTVSVNEYIEILASNNSIVSTVQECIFPNATLGRVYNIVNKPGLSYLNDELPVSNAEYSYSDGSITVAYEYKSEKHLYIEMLWVHSGGGFTVEIIERENETKSKVSTFAP